MQSDPARWRIGLVGYGEVGRILAEDLCLRGIAVSAYDRKLDGAATSAPLRAHAAQHGVTLRPGGAELAAQADLIVSAVTASQTVPAAQACAPTMQPGVFFLDFNSASPGAKQGSWGILGVDTTGWRRVVTTRLAQGLAGAGRWRRCSSLASVGAASVRRAGSVAQLALGTGSDAGWGRAGDFRAQWLTSISSLSAAGFQEMWPVRAPG